MSKISSNPLPVRKLPYESKTVIDRAKVDVTRLSTSTCLPVRQVNVEYVNKEKGKLNMVYIPCY